MAAPAIITTQSVLGFLQWQPFVFQPYATNSPTSWTASTLPSGVTINATSGRISGAATKPGVYVFALRAINGDGTSNPVVFTMGIEASSPTNGSDVDLSADVITKGVRLGRPTALAAVAQQGSAGFLDALGNVDKTKALFRATLEDDLILRLRLEKGGATVDPDITLIQLSMKEYNTENVIFQNSDVDFIRDGTGGDAGFRIYAKLSGDGITSATGDFDAPGGTEFPAIVEIEIEAINPDTATFGPASMRTSFVFLMIITRNQKAA